MIVSSDYMGDETSVVAKIEIVERAAGEGLRQLGPVAMNTSLGVVRVRITFHVGDRVLLTHDVHVHQMSLTAWYTAVIALVEGTDPDSGDVALGVESPELTLSLHRTGCSGGRTGGLYQFTIGVDAGILAPPAMVTGDAFGLTLLASGDEMIRFARDLLMEAQVVLGLGTYRRQAA